MSDELEHIWSRVQAELARAVGEATYRIWLEDLRADELVGERLRVEAPPQARGWIEARFGRLIQSCVATVLGPDVALELVSGECPDEPAHDGSAIREGRRPGSHSRNRHERVEQQIDPNQNNFAPRSGPLGNPKLSFDQFVIGDSNRLAHAAALTVAEMPAQAYNPLFICGPPGVGKTHLLSSIATLLVAHNPGLIVRCTTGEEFTNEFLGALSGGRTDGFKASFRLLDVLLVDDVQFLERKAKTEEEFFHTFNALYDAGRQIVLSSDRPPRDLQALEDRLRERFEAGLVADIKPPELATRLAILRKRADHDGIELADPQVLEAIAERVAMNVRALEGALIRVVAFSSLTGRSLTVELTREVLDGLYPANEHFERRRPKSVPEIQAAVGEHFGLSPEELLSTARTARIAWPRQVAMYLARELTGESLPSIGRHFGGRDHTTVLHAWRRTGARILTDDVSRQAVEKLCSQLGGERPQPQPTPPDRPA
ncbi:MAG TPA: chromosomal replication initiator protein DnaA [Solirubrobacteraceae bacterium]